jgi:uncharacterized surface protein with fasciclin (FAS1) repeats
MRLRTIVATGASAAAALTFAVPAFATEKVTPPSSTAPTIADVLLSDAASDKDGFDRNSRDFDIVTQAVLAFPDLTAAASDKAATLTVFAPNDHAFRKLVYDLTGKWYWKEADVFSNLVSAAGLDTIKTVLTYHIVPTAIPASVAVTANGAQLDTLQGGKIGVSVYHRWWGPSIELNDLDPDARNPWVVNFNVGGKLANGYVHGLNRVLRPVDLPQASYGKG